MSLSVAFTMPAASSLELTGPHLLSISVVLYRPKINDLQRQIQQLNASVARLKLKYATVQVSLHYVLNDASEAQLKILVNTIANAIDQLANDSAIDLLQLYANSKNSGYGRANNLIGLQVKTQFHLVLNPDVFVELQTLLTAIDAMKARPDVGLISPSVFGLQGQRQNLCKMKPSLLVFFLRSFAPGFLKRRFQRRIDQFEMSAMDYDNEALNLPYLTGCFMFFQTSVFQQVGGFDKRYFLHMEDADITRETLYVAQTLYLPEVKIIHAWSRSTHESFREKMITLVSALKYFAKWAFRRLPEQDRVLVYTKRNNE